MVLFTALKPLPPAARFELFCAIVNVLGLSVASVLHVAEPSWLLRGIMLCQVCMAIVHVKRAQRVLDEWATPLSLSALDASMGEVTAGRLQSDDGAETVAA